MHQNAIHLSECDIARCKIILQEYDTYNEHHLVEFSISETFWLENQESIHLFI